MTLSPTEKQKCIAEQAVYGDLKVLDRDNELWTYTGLGLSELMEGDCALYDDNDNVMYDWIDEVKPILRPMSDLTKEITHRGYNNDKPFVPLVELKIIGKIGHRGLYYEDGSFYGERSTALARDGFTGTFVHWNIPHQQQLLDLLHQWHFDTRNLIEKGEAIDVNTLDINPYSVKL